MRKRLALFLTPLVLVAALAVPASVAAASPYSYLVLQNYCNGDQPNIKVKMIKPAGYYPDKFTIAARGQHSNSGGGNWSAEGQSSLFSRNIPNQNAKYTWTQSVYWNPPDVKWHRIQLKLKVWDGGGVVATKTIYSVAC